VTTGYSEARTETTLRSPSRDAVAKALSPTTLKMPIATSARRPGRDKPPSAPNRGGRLTTRNPSASSQPVPRIPPVAQKGSAALAAWNSVK